MIYVSFSPQEKRRIQESIAKKRRQIEEEKLKLQYIKVVFTTRKAGENVFHLMWQDVVTTSDSKLEHY